MDGGFFVATSFDEEKNASEMHLAPRIAVHCYPLLSIVAYCCPLLSIVSVTRHIISDSGYLLSDLLSISTDLTVTLVSDDTY